MQVLGFVTVVILIFPQYVSSTRFYKCPEPQQNYDITSTAPPVDSVDYVTIPASLMSNFQSTDFRLELDIPYFCDMNYEVIKISLIGLNNMSINLTTLQPPVQDLSSNREEVESNSNSTVASRLYWSSAKSRSSSYFEGFIYSVGNITATFDTNENITEEEQTCDRKLNRNAVHFTPSGVMFYSGEYYRPQEYCIQSFDEASQDLIIQKCKIDCNNEQTPCIPLCCHLHEYADLSVPCCQATLGSRPIFQPVIYDDINRRASLEETIEPGGISKATYFNWSEVGNDVALRPHYVAFKHYESCPDGLEPLHLFFNENGESNLNTRIHIRRHGKAAYIGDDREWHFLENYCVAGIINAEGLDSMSAILKYCVEEEAHGVMWPNYLLIGVMAFSAVFLLLTLIVYVVLWEKQNVHGWTIMSFVTSEFFLFTSLCVAYAFGLFITADSASRTKTCVGSGILAHFFFLSTFSWLTVINLDLWWTFKSLTPLSERSKGRKRFCFYMTFAWGVPITVVSVGLALQSVYKENSSSIVVPDYGHRQCFLAPQAQGIYLYYIIGALLLVNCILISLTFYTIYKFKKSTRVASSSSSKSKERSFRLFIKLVVVMGVTWILEFIMWLDTEGQRFPWIFHLVELMNVLQAVVTFIIFVCKRKIMNQLEQKHPSLKVVTRPLLRLIGARSNSLMVSSSSKPTRSTTAGSSSFLGSRNKSQSQKQPSSTIAETKH